MTDKEKIRQEIERHLECVLDFIDSLPEDHIADASKMAQEESVSNDFDEVFGHLADVYYNNVLMDEHPMPEDIAHQCRLSYFLGLKAGANYQKQQDYIPVSKDLEEEIERYVNTPANQGNPDLRKELSECARHFARWQDEKDDKDTSDMLIVTYLRGGDEGKKIMVNKACEWLDGAIWDYIDLSNVPVNTYIHIDGNKFLQDFRKAMLEEE